MSLGADEQIQQLNMLTITHCLSFGFLVYSIHSLGLTLPNPGLVLSMFSVFLQGTFNEKSVSNLTYNKENNIKIII